MIYNLLNTIEFQFSFSKALKRLNSIFVENHQLSFFYSNPNTIESLLCLKDKISGDFIKIFLKNQDHFPQQYLYFLPLPQGQGSLRPTFPFFGTSDLWFSEGET